MTGQIASLNDPLGSSTAVGIQFDFGTGVLMKGHSGAPVLVHGRVIGLLRTAFLDKSEITMGGIVHAAGVQRVLEFCDRLRPGLLTLQAPVRWPDPQSIERPVLADRREEFDLFERMITGRSEQRVLLLQGASGTGKTVLTEHLLSYSKTLGVQVAHADCKGCPSMESVFNSILFKISEFLPTTKGAAGFARFPAFVEDFAALAEPVVIALDTWQHSTDDLREWVKGWLQNMHRMPGLVVVIAGQEVVSPEGQSWAHFAALRSLEGITSPQDWFEYTQRKWKSDRISEHHVEALVLGPERSGRPNAIDAWLNALHNNLLTASEGA